MTNIKFFCFALVVSLILAGLIQMCLYVAISGLQ